MSSEFQNMSNPEKIKFLASLEKKVLNEESQVRNKEQFMSNRVPDLLTAGSMSDVNKIIWPFTFSTGFMRTNTTKTSEQKVLRITQEAGFVALKIIKTVYERIDLGGGNYAYNLVNFRNGERVEDLRISWVDTASDRSFQQKPMSLNHLGDAFFPTKLHSRPFIMPSSSILFQLDAGANTKDYFTNISLIGYRIRVEDAKGLFTLVTE